MIPCGCYPCWCRREGIRNDRSFTQPCMRPGPVDSHVRIWKRGGYWTIEMFTGEELTGAEVGAPRAREAFDRAADWLTAQEAKQLQAILARNQETP
jgi:hypothetical protein